jgi:serine/threonine-protein kinase
MGEVYAARGSDGAELALKILHPHSTGVPNAALRFFREAEALARLPKGRAARIFDFGCTPDGVHYIVMERLFGEDLAARLRRAGRLPIAEVLVILEQMATVLDAASDLGIVHRDVKPRNIYLVHHEDGRIDARLLDFGVCRLLDAGLGAPIGRTAALLGTPGYLAPEQIADGFGEIGPHTDVFALGAVAYRALSGKNAFPSKNAATAVYEALNHHPRAMRTLVPELPEAMDAVLCLALAKRPEERYARASEFSADLRAAAAGKLDARVAERASALSARRTRSGTITSAA